MYIYIHTHTHNHTHTHTPPPPPSILPDDCPKRSVLLITKVHVRYTLGTR